MDGLLNLVSSGVETAFDLASELVKTGVYTKKSGNGSYDPVTDTKTNATLVITNVRFLQTTMDQEQREASPVAVADGKFLVPAIDIQGLDPGENDEFVLETGEKWNVLVSRPTPGKQLHIVFGRRA